jgi:RNA polymerase sigma factor (sigma-70 family)
MRTQKRQIDWSPMHVAMVLLWGRSGARKANVYGEDIEDCAAAFVEYIWQKRERIVVSCTPSEKEKTFFHMCAYQFAVSWMRTARRHPTTLTDDVTVLDSVVPNPCEVATLHTELWQLVVERMGDLAPHQQVLFFRCYVEEEERETIASEQGCTANAIKKVAQRARARLQTLLDQSGLSEPYLREYLR